MLSHDPPIGTSLVYLEIHEWLMFMVNVGKICHIYIYMDDMRVCNMLFSGTGHNL